MFAPFRQQFHCKIDIEAIPVFDSNLKAKLFCFFQLRKQLLQQLAMVPESWSYFSIISIGCDIRESDYTIIMSYVITAEFRCVSINYMFSMHKYLNLEKPIFCNYRKFCPCLYLRLSMLLWIRLALPVWSGIQVILITI